MTTNRFEQSSDALERFDQLWNIVRPNEDDPVGESDTLTAGMMTLPDGLKTSVVVRSVTKVGDKVLDGPQVRTLECLVDTQEPFKISDHIIKFRWDEYASCILLGLEVYITEVMTDWD